MTITTYDLELERPCTCDEGHVYVARLHPDDDGVRACPKCMGKGYVPTEQGEQLIEFLSRHFRSQMYREANRVVNQHECIYHLEGDDDAVPW